MPRNFSLYSAIVYKCTTCVQHVYTNWWFQLFEIDQGVIYLFYKLSRYMIIISYTYSLHSLVSSFYLEIWIPFGCYCEPISLFSVTHMNIIWQLPVVISTCNRINYLERIIAPCVIPSLWLKAYRPHWHLVPFKNLNWSKFKF